VETEKNESKPHYGIATIEMLAQLVWMNTELGEGEKLYRSGVRFIKIYPKGMAKL